MSKRYYDDWLTAFVEYASYGEAPYNMLFWSGVSTIAGALRRKVWIDQKYFQWLPNFYIIFVAPPGIVSKTTTANIGMQLLRSLPTGTINFGADVVTWQSLVASLGKSCESVPDPRDPGAFYPMSAVTFCSDELGNLLRTSDKDLINALITLWDGKQGAFKKDTKNSGNDSIINPWCNIIGCTTPAWISDNIPKHMLGGGFTSRCVFLYADAKRQLVAYPDEVVPKEFSEFQKRLVHDLEIISMLFGEFKIAEEAREWGRLWYKKHWEEAVRTVAGDQIQGYVARKQTHLHKLAMVVSASRSDELVITLRDLNAAEQLLTATETDMSKVFSRVGHNEITRGSTHIVYMVESRNGITQRELYQALFRDLTFKDFNDALAGAINSGSIICRQIGNEMRYYSTKTPDEHQVGNLH